jgi:hypothetical protein
MELIKFINAQQVESVNLYKNNTLVMTAKAIETWW